MFANFLNRIPKCPDDTSRAIFGRPSVAAFLGCAPEEIEKVTIRRGIYLEYMMVPVIFAQAQGGADGQRI